MGAPEDVAISGLRVSLGNILDSFGFATASDDSLDLLSDVMRRFMLSLSAKGKYYAEHAGRTDAAAKDITLAFKRINFCTQELVDFVNCNNLTPAKPLSKFPVPKPNPRPLYHPQPSEKELETRPEYIPHYMQAAHPEWTRDGADYLAVIKPSTSADKKGSAPDFPSFTSCTSKSMGISKEDRKPPPPIIPRKDDSSATGIRSSANIASQKLYNPDYAAQLMKKKIRPLNGLKDSRSNTPVGRSNSPFVSEVEDKYRTNSPTTSKSAEKQNFRRRTGFKIQDQKIEPGISMATLNEGALSPPMPKLHMENFDPDPSLDKSTSIEGSENDSFEQLETPPINEDLITANILLFQQLKQQQERQEKEKKDKVRQKEERLRKKEEEKEKKKEAARKEKEKKQEANLMKKFAKEEEKRKKKEERKLNQQQRTKEEKAVRDREAQAQVTALIEAQRQSEIKPISAPATNIFEEQKPLKLVISNPLSRTASSTFSPSPIRAPPSQRETSPPPAPQFVLNEEEDTVPYYDTTAETGPTTFPLNISTSEGESPLKKKKKKRDKDRDRDSPSPHKKHKKDKEHKKKKKKREKEEREHGRDKDNVFYKEPKPEIEQKPLTLKIRLGDQTPSNSDTSVSTYNEPFKLKFKLSTPDKKDEEKVAPLRLSVPLPRSTEKVKHSKSEIKSPKTSAEKEEKQRRKEERKKKDREEAEQRQRAEYERIQKEHEEKQKREAEERRKREEDAQQREKELRERDEAERRREKEKKRMERELAHIETNTELLMRKKEKEKEKEKEREKEKEKKKHTEEERKKDDSVSAPEVDEEEEKIWICPTCHVAWTEGANMVACDICNDWFHWHCVGLLVAPQEDIPWYCKKCSRKPMKRPIKPTSETPKKKKKSTEGYGYLK